MNKQARMNIKPHTPVRTHQARAATWLADAAWWRKAMSETAGPWQAWKDGPINTREVCKRNWLFAIGMCR